MDDFLDVGACMEIYEANTSYGKRNFEFEDDQPHINEGKKEGMYWHHIIVINLYCIKLLNQNLTH